MRVYLPATMQTLALLLESGAVGPAPLTGFAVTSGLQEWYVDDDLESLEYAALSEAARASLRLLDAAPASRRRRVVLAVDVAEGSVQVRDDLDRGVVHVQQPVTMGAVAAVHVDDADAEATVADAVDAIVAADLGDESARDKVDDAEGYELSWYANQEIGALLALPD